jgi:hypothetical protein
MFLVLVVMVAVVVASAVSAHAQPRQLDVFCIIGTFDLCSSDISIPSSPEFSCKGTPQTNNVTCTNQQTGEDFSCVFVGTIPNTDRDQYSCEVEKVPPEEAPPRGGNVEIGQEIEQEAESGDIDQSFEVASSGDNSNQCPEIQGVANAGNAQNAQGIVQFDSEADDFEFEEVGSDIAVSPAATTTCDQTVNQAAAASG